nr:alpha-L-fucosidase [Muribaculaceae bacterium]
MTATKLRLASALLLAATAMNVVAEKEYFVKEVTFPSEATIDQKIEMASRLVPSDKQLSWQQLELTAFIHFGMNTFTDREWGDGTESPSVFNPAELDAEQWISTLSEAGFKLVILTAKHHDGFCLWPTATTPHSVASSPWLDGKGDVMRQFADACARYGMKMGVYLSPWDRNAPEYGDSEAYNDKFVAQLTELLTGYGRVDEVWFDGACGEGPNGKKQVYDWNRFADVIHRLQPDAVTAIMGDDVRWVGNEKGEGRETEWSATAITPGILAGADESNSKLGLEAKSPDLGGREILAKADKLYWWPSEVDVSIRPGWFYHDREQPKPLYKLAQIYLNSVGRNSALLLNIPPDRRGRLADADVRRIGELGRWIRKNFTRNLVTGDLGDNTVRLTPGSKVNCVVLREDISRGQRVEQFRLHALTGGRWSEIARGTTIGNKRIVTFDTVNADALQLHVVSARGETHLLPVEAYMIAMPDESDEDFGDCRIIDKSGWELLYASAGVSLDEARAAIDGNSATIWQ